MLQEQSKTKTVTCMRKMQGVRARAAFGAPGSRENPSAHMKKARTGFDWIEDVKAFSGEGLTA